MDYTRIRTKVENGIETITLDYQQTLNAVDLTMALELEDALTKADKDEEVKVIVMEGAGRAFSAGGDIRYMKAHCEEPDFCHEIHGSPGRETGRRHHPYEETFQDHRLRCPRCMRRWRNEPGTGR